ncbi:hypothetical protein [Gemmobacter serpentinus]|uniref:hypothetical protein n=1 Tax=Gemmobacter serpentinus TaxID=2652247 RepID=UPI00124BDCB9|nr:hypothetical protein [Gemmobacter serpentinus]
MSRVTRDSLLTGPAALEPGERLVTSFRADHAVYIRNMMIVMLVAGAVLALAETLRGAAYPWAIPAFAICMIGLRAWHMAGLAMSLEWQLTDRRLIGPGGRVIPLAEISAVRNILGTVLVMQKGAKPAVIRFHPYPKGVIAALTAASTGGRP